MSEGKKTLAEQLRERDHTASRNGRHQAPAPGHHPEEAYGDPEPWEPPVSLTEMPEAAAFPLDVLPAPLARFIGAVAAATHGPPDYAAVPLLTVAGAAIGASRTLELKPGWRERPCLYAAVIGPTGGEKTPALKRVVAPVYAEQSRRLANYRRRLLGWEESDDPTKGPAPKMETYFVSDITIEKCPCCAKTRPSRLASTANAPRVASAPPGMAKSSHWPTRGKRNSLTGKHLKCARPAPAPRSRRSRPRRRMPRTSDGKTLAAGTGEGTIQLWDGVSGKSLGGMLDPLDGWLCVAFAPNDVTGAGMPWRPHTLPSD
jgi:hypothetical protein